MGYVIEVGHNEDSLRKDGSKKTRVAGQLLICKFQLVRGSPPARLRSKCFAGGSVAIFRKGVSKKPQKKHCSVTITKVFAGVPEGFTDSNLLQQPADLASS